MLRLREYPAESQLGFRSVVFCAAAVVLGWVQYLFKWSATDKSYHWTAVAFGLVLLGILVKLPWAIERFTRHVVVPLLAIACAFILYLLLRIGREEYGTPENFAPLVSTAALLIGLGLASVPRFEIWRVPLLLAVYATLGAWIIRAVPAPPIDVWVWHNEALVGLLSGKNPYAMTMPNIYPDTTYFDPGMVVNGRVQVGFHYPPMSLYCAIPGYVLGGDYRYSTLAAMCLAGGFIAYARPGSLGTTAMCLWLFSPRTLFIIEQGWTEPFVILLLAATLFAAVRKSKWLFIPLGMLFAVKHHIALAAPLLLLLPCAPDTPRDRLRLVLRAAAVAIGVTLPFLLLDARALWNDLVTFQLRQPFRPEALSVLAWWAREYGTRPPTWIGFAVLVPAILLGLWRCERSASGFVAALALMFFAFFGFSKQAFCNHYFFILALICCVVALADPAPDGKPAELSAPRS